MKISDVKNIKVEKKNFYINKEKLSSFDLISKVYSDGVELEPGCDKCEWGRIRTKSETGFWYTTSICDCVALVEEVEKMVAELKLAGITPKMMTKYGVDNFVDWMFSIDELAELLKKDKWLYLYGDVWTWKTHAAFVALYLCMVSWHPIQYANVPRLLDMLRPQEGNANDRLMDELCEVEVLVLDDIGQEKVSVWVLERLYIIINERYVHDKKTIITSNVDIPKLLEKLGHRAIVSRIKGSSIAVNFIWKDKR